jgi:hypothetical protein
MKESFFQTELFTQLALSCGNAPLLSQVYQKNTTFLGAKYIEVES